MGVLATKRFTSIAALGRHAAIVTTIPGGGALAAPSFTRWTLVLGFDGVIFEFLLKFVLET